MQSAQEFTIGKIQTTTIDDSPVKCNQIYKTDITDIFSDLNAGNDSRKTGISKAAFAADFNKKY